jgi:hypothetical protein
VRWIVRLLAVMALAQTWFPSPWAAALFGAGIAAGVYWLFGPAPGTLNPFLNIAYKPPPYQMTGQGEGGVATGLIVSNRILMLLLACGCFLTVGLVAMKHDLDKEKRAMNKIWDKRDKQIGRVLLNIGGMHGDIEGLAGMSLPKIETLELGDAEGEEEAEY